MYCWFFSVRELTEEEKTAIIKTEDFQCFLDRSSRVIERAMAQDVDIFTDYSGIDGEGEEGWVSFRSYFRIILRVWLDLQSYYVFEYSK